MTFLQKNSSPRTMRCSLVHSKAKHPPRMECQSHYTFAYPQSGVYNPLSTSALLSPTSPTLSSKHRKSISTPSWGDLKIPTYIRDEPGQFSRNGDIYDIWLSPSDFFSKLQACWLLILCLKTECDYVDGFVLSKIRHENTICSASGENE
jgi:hypothetical protein